MDLKEFGIEELTHEEATDIDGGGLIKIITAIARPFFLFWRMSRNDFSLLNPLQHLRNL